MPRHLAAVQALLALAQARGEAVRPVAPVTLMLPYDLLRIENLVRPGNLNQDRLTTMVEEVLLPVFIAPSVSGL